jgi:CBS domain containing-hemolysin-like protein
MNATAWFLMVILIVANGYFVAVEFSLVASNRSRLEQLAAITGQARYRRALHAVAHLGDYIAGVQLGVTITSLGLGAVAEPAVAAVLDNVFGVGHWLPHRFVTGTSFVIAFAFVAFLHTVFGELVPKNLAIIDAEQTLGWLVVPMRAFVTIFRPVIRALDLLASAGLRILRVERRQELVTAHTAEELGHVFTESHRGGLLGDVEHRRLADAIGFAARPVRDVMVPRDQIVAIERSTPLPDVEDRLLDSGHSRLPIYDRDIDHVLGFVHVKDLLEIEGEMADRPVPLRSVRRMLLVSVNRHLPDVLTLMRRSRLHVALVVDSDGRTAGLVTLEDLLEELVGEIDDETDRAAPQ